ncbi:MAG TPA: hypothetical protein VF914_17580 [Chloroflexia bacterium]|jgi:hypothetical protein
MPKFRTYEGAARWHRKQVRDQVKLLEGLGHEFNAAHEMLEGARNPAEETVWTLRLRDVEGQRDSALAELWSRLVAQDQLEWDWR